VTKRRRKIDEAAVGAKLDAIEAEMKRIGYWVSDPPDLLAEIDAGRIGSYLDAPSFELWLQAVFFPRAREAVSTGDFPQGSQVGEMARRQYDYQSHVPEAQDLLRLLREFDGLIGNG